MSEETREPEAWTPETYKAAWDAALAAEAASVDDDEPKPERKRASRS
jgi:hypothetical protein